MSLLTRLFSPRLCGFVLGGLILGGSLAAWRVSSRPEQAASTASLMAAVSQERNADADTRAVAEGFTRAVAALIQSPEIRNKALQRLKPQWPEPPVHELRVEWNAESPLIRVTLLSEQKVFVQPALEALLAEYEVFRRSARDQLVSERFDVVVQKIESREKELGILHAKLARLRADVALPGHKEEAERLRSEVATLRLQNAPPADIARVEALLNTTLDIDAQLQELEMQREEIARNHLRLTDLFTTLGPPSDLTVYGGVVVLEPPGAAHVASLPWMRETVSGMLIGAFIGVLLFGGGCIMGQRRG